MSKRNNPRRYAYDPTWFFKQLRYYHITQFAFCDRANISPSVLQRYYKGHNVESDTLIHFVEVLEKLVGHRLEDRNMIFNLIEIDKDSNKNK